MNRVSRFVMTGDTIDPASEVVLLDNISSVNGNHNGGDLDVGGDGFLYVSVIGDGGPDPGGALGRGRQQRRGEDVVCSTARSSASTGSRGRGGGEPVSGSRNGRRASAGNTPTPPATRCAELYASGLRNPWRIVFDPNSRGPLLHRRRRPGAREEVDDGSSVPTTAGTAGRANAPTTRTRRVRAHRPG